MTREKMMDKVIRQYGFENDCVIKFCTICERSPHTRKYNKGIKALYKFYLANPQTVYGFDDQSKPWSAESVKLYSIEKCKLKLDRKMQAQARSVEKSSKKCLTNKK